MLLNDSQRAIGVLLVALMLAAGWRLVVVKNFDSVQSHDIQYSDGLRYPHLERISERNDFLGGILRAKDIEVNQRCIGLAREEFASRRLESAYDHV